MFATPTRNTQRRFSLYKIVAMVVCIATLLPVPTHSFGNLQPTSSLGRRTTSSLPTSSFQTELWLSPNNKNNNNNKDDEGVGSKENDELKQIVGAVFVALLAAEFFLTPVLKPIVLAAKDSS